MLIKFEADSNLNTDHTLVHLALNRCVDDLVLDHTSSNCMFSYTGFLSNILTPNLLASQVWL